MFAVLALRATGIGFIMITLALGQIIWGLAYRWISVTGGDNGINVHGRPAPFGFELGTPTAFYYATLVVFLIAVVVVAIFVRSPFGAALKGTRDQPRRMNALGYHVWAIRFWACLFSGLLTAVAGILFVYYTQFISPQTTGADRFGRSAADGDLRRRRRRCSARSSARRWWSIVKNVVSGYIERWNFLLGAIFVAIVILMPEGLVPGTRAAVAAGLAGVPPPPQRRQRRQRGAEAMSALTVNRLCKAFGGLRVTTDVNLNVEPGERRLIIGPNGAGKTTLFNLITGELTPDCGSIHAVRPGHHARCRAAAAPHLGMARTYQIITLFPRDTIVRNVTLALLGLVEAALESADRASTGNAT